MFDFFFFFFLLILSREIFIVKKRLASNNIKRICFFKWRISVVISFHSYFSPILVYREFKRKSIWSYKLVLNLHVTASCGQTWVRYMTKRSSKLELPMQKIYFQNMHWSPKFAVLISLHFNPLWTNVSRRYDSKDLETKISDSRNPIFDITWRRRGNL